MFCACNIATSIMINDLQIEVDQSVIKSTWSAPKYLPLSYTQVVQCSLLCDVLNVSYYQQTMTKLKNEIDLIFVVSLLRPGSRCKITFRAVYNPICKDPGIISTVDTPIASKSGVYIDKETMLTF